MRKLTIEMETLTCPSCIIKIEKLLKSLEGIDKDSVKVSFSSSKARLNFDDTKIKPEEIKESIGKLGYEVLKIKAR